MTQEHVRVRTAKQLCGWLVLLLLGSVSAAAEGKRRWSGELVLQGDLAVEALELCVLPERRAWTARETCPVPISVNELRVGGELPAGEHVLWLRSEDYPEKEVRLAGPGHLGQIIYPETQAVSVEISPPFFPDGSNWNLSVLGEDNLEVIESVATEAGVGSLRLLPGEYQIRVEGGEYRGVYGSSVLVVVDRPEELFVLVDVIPVRGEVRWRGEPYLGGDGARRLEAVVFGSTQARLRIGMPLDGEGRFEGHVTREGAWPVDLLQLDGGSRATPVQQVQRRPGRAIAWVGIELPDGELTVEVVDGDRSAVPEASVIVFRVEDRSRVGTGLTDSSGRLTLQGVAAGELVVEAKAGALSSGLVRLELEKGATLERQVVLGEATELAGQVYWPSGQPVVGATVVIRPYDKAWQLAGSERRSRTGSAGEFSVEIKAAEQYAAMVVTPEAVGFSSRRGDLEGPWLLGIAASLGRVSFSHETVAQFRSEMAPPGLRGEGSPVVWPLQYFLQLSGRHVEFDDIEVHWMRVPWGRYAVCSTLQTQECSSWSATY